MKCKKHGHESEKECPGCASEKRMTESTINRLSEMRKQKEANRPTVPALDQNAVNQINSAFRQFEQRVKKLETKEPSKLNPALMRIAKAVVLAVVTEVYDLYMPQPKE